jgi:hypothetical protein
MEYVYLYRPNVWPYYKVEVSETFSSESEATLSLFAAQSKGNVGGGYVMPLGEAQELYPDLFGA